MNHRTDAIHIVGAGGIGCAVGYALLEAGVSVVFVDDNPAKVEAGNVEGVRIDQMPPLFAPFVPFMDWRPRLASLLILSTKCYDNERVLERLSGDEQVIPIQNGFDPKLSQRDHPFEGIASFVSECHSQKPHTRITRRGMLHIGRRHSSLHEKSPLVHWLSRNRHFPTKWVDAILPYKYTKLMYNAAISPIASVAGIDNGQLLSVPAARRLFFALLRENYTILHDARIPLATIGPFHPDTVQRILRRRWLARALAWAFYPSLRGSYCSMSEDLPRGRTEIDHYNGHLIELAQGNGCLLNRAVLELVKRLERSRDEPRITNLHELLPFADRSAPDARTQSSYRRESESCAADLAPPRQIR
jgi:2-dehydropantoate 2-reductase